MTLSEYQKRMIVVTMKQKIEQAQEVQKTTDDEDLFMEIEHLIPELCDIIDIMEGFYDE